MPHSAIRSTALIVASALLAGSVWASDPPAPQAAASSQPATTPVPVQAPAAAATVDPATAAAPAAAEKPKAAAQVVCREEKKTGSRLQTRKVCTTPGSQDSSADWVREQQARGAIGASAIVNGQ
jgi:hypothetical protein